MNALYRQYKKQSIFANQTLLLINLINLNLKKNKKQRKNNNCCCPTFMERNLNIVHSKSTQPISPSDKLPRILVSAREDSTRPDTDSFSAPMKTA